MEESSQKVKKLSSVTTNLITIMSVLIKLLIYVKECPRQVMLFLNYI